MRFVPHLLVLVATVALADLPVRAETTPRYRVDEAYLRDGGVQHFYELIRKEDALKKSPTFAFFQPFDWKDRHGAQKEPVHVVMGRVTYVVDTDVSFFSEKQIRDPAYINTVAKDFGISLKPDGSYTASKSPSNSFRLSYFDREAVQALAESRDGGIAQLAGLDPLDGGTPEVVVLQENYDFARVMGWRTGEMSVTWTAHYRYGEKQTLLDVCTMSYLHATPPFFLGGDARVQRESLQGTTLFIENLRRYVKKPTTAAPR